MDIYDIGFDNVKSMNEIDWFSRVGPIGQDPWIEKMQNLPKMFSDKILSTQLLKQLRSKKIMCSEQSESKFRFGMHDYLSSLNPLATSLGYDILNDDGTGLDEVKIKTIKNLLSAGGSCRTDKDCKNIKCNSKCLLFTCKKCKELKLLTECRNSKCSYPLVDIGSVVRYGKLWLRVLEGKKSVLPTSGGDEYDGGYGSDGGDEYDGGYGSDGGDEYDGGYGSDGGDEYDGGYGSDIGF